MCYPAYPAYPRPQFVPVMYVSYPPSHWYPIPHPHYYGEGDYRGLSVQKAAPSMAEPSFEEIEVTNARLSSLTNEIASIHQRIARIKEDMDNLGKLKEEGRGLSDAILRLNGAIRYVAVLDSSNNLLEFKSREEGSNLTLGDAMKDFISIGPLIMLGAVERLRPFYGGVKYIATRLKECLLIVYETANRYVVLILEPAVNTQLADQIGAALKELMPQT